MNLSLPEPIWPPRLSLFIYQSAVSNRLINELQVFVFVMQIHAHTHRHRETCMQTFCPPFKPISHIPLSKHAANDILLLWSLVCKTDMIDDHRRHRAG